MQHYYFFLVWIFLYNFPYFSKYLHTKPIYYEDLNSKNNELNFNQARKKKFQKLFITIQQITLSLAFVFVFEYSFNRLKNTPFNFTELLALLGGFFTLYEKISSNLGMLLIKYLYREKKRSEKKAKKIELNLLNKKSASVEINNKIKELDKNII